MKTENCLCQGSCQQEESSSLEFSSTAEARYCQSCGMPLTEEIDSHSVAELNLLGTNADGSKNEDYCIYCYKDGAFTGDFTMEQMAEYCSMFVEEYNKNTGQNLTACEYKQELLKFFPTLKRWKDNSSPRGGQEGALPHADHPMKKVFIEEVNALGIPGLNVDNLYVLQGSFINQPYNINGNEVKLLDDNATYWGNQVIAPSPKGEGKGRGCYGIACCEKFILVSEYGKDGTDPELVILKRR